MGTFLAITRGDRKTFGPWSLTDDADKALADATIRMMFRRDVDGEMVLVITKTLADGHMDIVSDEPGDRSFTVTLVADDTSGLEDERVRLFWDLQLSYADTEGPYTLDEGVLTVTPDLTRP